MSGLISMGCCRESDGTTSRTVFCNYCREVFANRVSFAKSREVFYQAKRDHKCEKFCDDHCTWLDHHKECGFGFEQALSRVADENDKKSDQEIVNAWKKSDFAEVM